MIWCAFFIAVALIFIGFLYLNKTEKIEVAGALFVALGPVWIETVQFKKKERNPLLNNKENG